MTHALKFRICICRDELNRVMAEKAILSARADELAKELETLNIEAAVEQMQREYRPQVVKKVSMEIV